MRGEGGVWTLMGRKCRGDMGWMGVCMYRCNFPASERASRSLGKDFDQVTVLATM